MTDEIRHTYFILNTMQRANMTTPETMNVATSNMDQTNTIDIPEEENSWDKEEVSINMR
jgi:hypothetical protein